MKKRSVIAWILCVAMLLFAVASSFCPVGSLGHQCLGHNCQVCYQVRLCADLLHGLSLCGTMLCVAFGVLCVMREILSAFRCCILWQTPITRKEKLSD